MTFPSGNPKEGKRLQREGSFSKGSEWKLWNVVCFERIPEIFCVFVYFSIFLLRCYNDNGNAGDDDENLILLLAHTDNDCLCIHEVDFHLNSCYCRSRIHHTFTWVLGFTRPLFLSDFRWFFRYNFALFLFFHSFCRSFWHACV